MGTRLSLLCASLLALPFSAAALATPESTAVTAGEIQLAFSSDGTSTFPIDVQALAEGQCDPAGPPLNNNVKCNLTVPEGNNSSLLRVAILPPSDDPSRPLPWQVIGLEIKAQPVDTSCGTWDVSLSLDTVPQPVTALHLTPSEEDPGSGIFTGDLEMRVRLHLANPGTEQSVDEPVLFDIDMAGSWMIEPPDDSSGDASGASNLQISFGWPKGSCFNVVPTESSKLLRPFACASCPACLVPRMFKLPSYPGGPK